MLATHTKEKHDLPFPLTYRYRATTAEEKTNKIDSHFITRRKENRTSRDLALVLSGALKPA